MEIEHHVAEGFYKTKRYLFDPADWDGNDLTEIPNGKGFKRPVPKAMFGPLYTGPRYRRKLKPADVKRMSATELHEFVSRYDWQDGVALLRSAIKNPRCDFGTALMIYWRCDPHYLSQYRSIKDVPAQDMDEYELMTDVEGRLLEGRFASRLIKFDPADDNGVDSTVNEYLDLVAKRKIPRALLNPVS